MFVTECSTAVMVSWKPKIEPPSPTGSVAIACMVTSYARILLYQVYLFISKVINV